MIAENPVEAQVKSSTEQQGVEEDTEDEDLLGYSDEVIIHPAGSQSVQVVQSPRPRADRSPDHHNAATAFIRLSFGASIVIRVIMHIINYVIGSFK